MSLWRTRGYVPDSDEEEDILSLSAGAPRDKAEQTTSQAPKAAISADHHSNSTDAPFSVLSGTTNQSTAQQLESVLGHGLQTIRDVLATSPAAFGPDDVAFWNSGEDSPLSSPPSTTIGSPARETRLDSDTALSTTVLEAGIAERRAYAASAVQRRGLRARAPIQEHPYMLEDAKYRQLMKDRGLRPVNAPSVSTGIEKSVVQDESQQTEDSQGLHETESFELSDLSYPPSPKQVEAGSERDHPVGDSWPSEPNVEDGLLDLSAILRERKQKSKRTYQVKGRPPKLIGSLHPARPETADVFDIPDNESPVLGMSSHTQGFRVPPSPPHSDNTHMAQSDEDEDVVSRHKSRRSLDTPMALPTPLMSSDVGNRKRPTTAISDSDSSAIEDDALSSSSQSAEDDSQGLKWIKNKLRGVLPPSFLKLDAQRKPHDRSKQQQQPPSSMVSGNNERGVARRSTVSRVPASSRTATLQLFQSELSESDETDGMNRRVHKTVALPKPSPTPRNADHESWFDDVVEDNEVDHMLPSNPRRRSSTQPRKPRQGRVDDGWAVINRRSTADVRTGMSGEGVPHTKKRRTGIRSAKRQKSRHPRRRAVMNVSDAPGLYEIQRDAQPQFLKVAARQAKSITHEAAHSPSKKFFQLATEDDTRDVHNEMRMWENNRSKSGLSRHGSAAVFNTQHRSSTPRQPVRDPIMHSRSTTDLDNLKRSTNGLLSRLSGQASHLKEHRHITTVIPSIDPTAEKEDRSNTERLRSIFAHRNRSGQGEFLSRTPAPRAAQVESEILTIHPITKIPVRAVLKVSDRPRVVAASYEPTTLQTHAITVNNPETSRAPRKQIPKKYTKPIPKMDDEIPASPVHEDRGHVRTSSTQLQATKPALPVKKVERAIEPVLRAVQTLQLPPGGTQFYTNSPVGEQYLRKLLARCSDEGYDPTKPTNVTHYISAPLSQKLSNCGRLDSSVQSPVQGALDEVHRAVLGDDINITNDTELYEDCIRSLRSIVDYLDIAAYFPDEPSIGRFVEESENRIQRFLTAVPTQSANHNLQTVSMMLSCLNWMAVIAAYLYKFSTYLSHDSSQVQGKVKILYQRLLRQILDLVYTDQILEASLATLQDVFDPINSLLHSIYSFPEADSIVIVWHLNKINFAGEVPQNFYQDFKARFIVSETVNAYNQLRSCLLALCFTLPLLKISTRGDSYQQLREIEDIDCACFLLLAAHVENVAKNLKSGEAPRSVGQLLEAVEDVSIKMVKIWEWTPPPAMVTALLKAYAWNAWLPFSNVLDVNLIIEDLNHSSIDIDYRPDNDFYKFLDLIGLCMETFYLQHDGRGGVRDPGKVRGFVFSLLPNNAWSFDAQDSIPTKNLVAFKNYAALHIKIFETVPEGFQPRLEDMKYHVNFVNSHSFVCKLAAAAWKRITLFYIQREYSGQTSLKAANSWMESMLHQSITFLDEKPRVSESIRRLEDLLLTFAHVLQQCDTELKSRLLLSDGVFKTLQRLLNDPEVHGDNDDITTACLYLLNAYASTLEERSIEKDFTTDIHLLLKTVIQHVLGNRREHRFELIHILTDTWFLFAKHMVRTFHRHWNDFVEPHSGLSIDFLSGLRNSYATYDAKQIFYSHLLEADKHLVFLEYRPIVFMTWIVTLLVPIQSMRFDPVLTNTILTTEKDSLMIKDLADILFKKDHDRQLTKQNVADSRIIILRHIIQNIHDQQECPEEEWIPGGLDARALKDLLRTMASTMKDNWLALKDSPVEQNDYTALVHAILNEMEAHPVPGFKIDPWFTGASEFPRQIRTLDSVFTCRFGTSRDTIDKDMIRTFIRQYLREIVAERTDFLLDELLRVFHCTDPLRLRTIDGETQYSIDIARQTKFLQVIVPAFIECASKKNNSALISPLLHFLTDITERLPLRIDNLNEENMSRFIEMTAAILRAIRKLLRNTQTLHAATTQALEYTRLAMATVFSLVECGVPITESVHQWCMGNILRIYDIVTRNLALLPKKPVEQAMNEVDVTGDFGPAIAVIDEEQNIVRDGWSGPPAESFELVPEELKWVLFFQAKEPELSEEEKGLRELAAAELKGWEEKIKVVGVERSWGWCDREELREAMLGFLRDVKGRDLLVVVEEDDDE